MSNMSESFVTCIPTTEEDMLAVGSDIAQRCTTFEQYDGYVEYLEQLVDVLKEKKERMLKKRNASQG